MRKISNPNTKAEGDVYLRDVDQVFPYVTQLAGPNGCVIHFWMGSRFGDKELRNRLLQKSKNFRDVLSGSYSEGVPSGYWAHQNME